VHNKAEALGHNLGSNVADNIEDMGYIIAETFAGVVEDKERVPSFIVALMELNEVIYQDLCVASIHDKIDLVVDDENGICLLVIFYQLFDVHVGSQPNCMSY